MSLSSTKSTKKRKPMEKLWGYIKEYWQTTDRVLFLLCFLLSGASLLFLYSMVHAQFTEMSRVYVQIIAIGLGIFSAIFISQFDYRSLLKLWKLYVPAAVLFVLLTFIWGVEKGAENKAWLYISLGARTVSVQPAEFLKISFITTFALHLNYVREKLNKISTVLLLCLHGGAHILLIAAQGDDGTALIFVGIFVIMLFMAGISWKYVIAGVAALVPMVPLGWKFLLSEYQKQRFRVLWDPTISADVSFQQDRGLTALGVGGVQGVGLFADKHVYVPEMYNDFIFTYIGETLGIMGCIGILILLLALCYKILYNSGMAVDMTGRMICVGVFAMILTQTVVNIGMTLKLTPTIGVTLPFLSSGGSSVLALYFGIGLVISVYRHSKISFFGKKT